MLGDMVRAGRRRISVSQQELAERAGLSVRSIGNIENGRIATPRASTVRLLADALELAGPVREAFFAAAVGRRSGQPRVDRSYGTTA